MFKVRAWSPVTAVTAPSRLPEPSPRCLGASPQARPEAFPATGPAASRPRGSFTGLLGMSGCRAEARDPRAVGDACKLMGERKFHRIIVEDERVFPKSKVTDIMDVVTVQDYIQYRSFFDEAPAFSGGRNNSWRKLNLESIPRTTLMYDIVHYSESGVISNRLRNEMKFLLQRPVTQEIHKHQLRIVSENRGPSLTVQPLYRPYKQQNQVKFLGRRSKQAQMKVEKMRKVYLAKEKNTSEVTEQKTDPSGTKDNCHLHSIF
ncbi:putative uncharacterized protein CXorf58 homolog [Piliocolobus tephrosceles]|uniref:putative uncharacterized protein CXorf58 homolog n=1 Tax=Piliocolobus tephrosceles TaxID=591936 RepID=UPI00130141F2|nr:putative uncharacterized protein CXorf58 homolog [Piliocolobus tephrosceles]